MPRTRYRTEQSVTELRQAEVELSGRSAPAPGLQEARGQRVDVRPLAEGGRRLAPRPGKALEGARASKHAAEEAGGRPGTRQQDSPRGGLGKLLSPSRRRPAVVLVQHRLGVSERRACRVLSQARSTHRHRPVVPDDEPQLVARLIEVTTLSGRDGYRRSTGLLRGEGWTVNHQRIERLWRRDGLTGPQKQPKRGRLWLADGSCIRRRPEYRHHVWAYDCVADRTHDGRPLKILTIVEVAVA